MVIGALKSNLATRDDCSVVQLHKAEPQQFYISNVIQEARLWRKIKFRLIQAYKTSILVKSWPMKV